MIEFTNLQDAFNYISQNNVSRLIIDGEKFIVYCNCNNIPENAMIINNVNEIIYN